MTNDNKPPSRINFSKHLDRKLHSHLEWPYKGLTQPLQTDTAKPRPAKRRVSGATTVVTVTAAVAAARTKTSSTYISAIVHLTNIKCLLHY